VLQTSSWLEGIVHIQLQLGGMALTVCALFWPKWQQLHAILMVPLVDFGTWGLFSRQGKDFPSACEHLLFVTFCGAKICKNAQKMLKIF